MTALSGSKPGAAGGAVTAVNEWREYAFDETFTPLATSSATLVSYFVHVTPILSAGTYELRASLATGNSASNAQLETSVELDGMPLGGTLRQTGIAAGRDLFSAQQVIVFGAPAVHTFEFFIALPGGTGTITAFFAVSIFERKA